MSFSMDDFMAMPFDSAKRALGSGEMPAMLEAPRRHQQPMMNNIYQHQHQQQQQQSWETDSEPWPGGGGAEPQRQLLADWGDARGRRGSDSSWSSSVPSTRGSEEQWTSRSSAQQQYPDSFTGKGRARHPVLADAQAEPPKYVGNGGHSFSANQARKGGGFGSGRTGTDLQPTAPGGRTGGWPAGGGGGGGAGGSGGGGGVRPSRAAAGAPAHVIAAPVAD